MSPPITTTPIGARQLPSPVNEKAMGSMPATIAPQTSAGRPHAAGRAKASKLSTVRRAGGARQVDYAGHPLYRFSLDSSPGMTSGQGLEAFGGRWYIVAPSGRAITGGGSSGTGYGSAPSPAPAPTPSSGGGYGY